MKTAIRIHQLTYQYEKSPVLQDLTFHIPRGEFFIIIGPNGSGKTTLLKLLSGIIPKQMGQIDIQGKAIERYPRKRLAQSVAYVPQSFATDFPFSVKEIVLMGRTPHLGLLGMETARDADLALQSMQYTGVDHLADRKIDQISGGERQRVFIARAICQEPQIMLLDEPTASLDLTHQILLMDLLAQLKEDKRLTVVMVSHDINLAAMYCDTLMLLKSGKIVEHGRPEKVLTFETIEMVYGCTVLVDNSPLGDIPRVTPVPKKYKH